MATFEERLKAVRQPTQQTLQGDFANRLNATRQTPQPEPVPEVVKPTKEEEPWYEDFGEGLAVSGMGTYYGIKDLFGAMDDEDRATLTDWQEDAAESGWGTAGEIVGEIAQIALPAGAATKGLKLASKAKNLGRTAPLLIDAAATAGLEATKLPQEGESRLDSAVEGATDALTGGMLTRALSKATRGVDITDQAKKILDNGGFLTAGKAADSKAVQMLENVAEVTPFLAKGVKKGQEKAKKSWEDIVMKEAAPSGVTITSKGQDGVRQLKNAYDDAYGKAWAKADSIDTKGRVDFVNAVSRGMEELPAADANKVLRIGKEFNKVLADSTPKRIKDYDNLLRRELKSVARDNAPMLETLKGMREAVRTGLPASAKNAIKEVDATYPKYLVVKKATAKAAEEAGDFSPKQLVQAVKSVGGETRTALGDAPLQDLATAGAQTIDKKVGGQPLEWFRRVSGGVPTPVPVQTLSNLTIGQNPLQKAARRTVESETIDALRKYMPRGGQLGGVLLDDELQE